MKLRRTSPLVYLLAAGATVLIVVVLLSQIPGDNPPTCEQIVENECRPNEAYEIGFTNWRHNLSTFVETGVLTEHGLPDQESDYARLGFTVCYYVDEFQLDFQAWLQTAPQSTGLDRQVAVLVWNTALDTLCPEHADAKVTT